MKPFFGRYRVAVALFAFSTVLLIGGGRCLRALSRPPTMLFPENGHLILDYISGNRAYSVWHTDKGLAVCRVKYRPDGSEVPAIIESYDVGIRENRTLVTRFDLRKEGAYDFYFSGPAGDRAYLVEENGFIWVIPAMVCGMTAFATFLGGMLAVFVIKRRSSVAGA